MVKNPNNKEYLSKEKFKVLTSELENLKTVKRKQIAEELEFAKGLGDLSENAEYHEAREAQATLEDRILQLESILANAEIVAKHHSDVVEVGSVVHIKKTGDKAERVYHIVGSEEADTATGKISFKSPLGQALLGKKKGEDFKFKTPSGEAKYTVVSVE
jgi:transcription elongation factor GreA